MDIRSILTSSVLAAALATSSLAQTTSPAPAAPTETAHVGETLRDANMARLGTISDVAADGSVQIIYDSQFVTVPGKTLTVSNGVVKTSLTKKDVSKLER